ncbi:MAG: exodeoxyribonuclease VII large subunit, partial [Clostridia bacterium]|nr:exodeoxyribonuclease VII large subunit [Clostridia bacterium]
VSPCAVQGAGAAEEIVSAIECLNRQGACDVLLVGRGGGSIEDLWAFNEEVVARAIAASRIPVISCVGHEIDFTISDFAADLRAPTPSAAAELAVPRLDEMRASLSGLIQRLSGALASAQQIRRLRLERAMAASCLSAPARALIEPRRLALRGVWERAGAAMPVLLERGRHRLNAMDASLRALNPSAVLDRGDARVLQEGRVVTGIGGVDTGAQIGVRLSDGELTAKVLSIAPKDEDK